MTSPEKKVSSPAMNVRWQGRAQKLGGHWVVFVPLNEGGAQLKSITRGLSDIEGDSLKIVLPTWLADQLAVTTERLLTVETIDGQFNIRAD